MRSLLLALSALALLVGCYSTREGGDAGPPPADGFRPRPDTGPAVDCRTEVVARWEGEPPCSESVNACIGRCMTTGEEGCVEMCLASEPTCQRCFYQTVIACGNEMGCDDAWHDFACCTESVPICGTARGFERLNCAGSCMTEIEAWSGCLESVGIMSCVLETQMRCDLRFTGG